MTASQAVSRRKRLWLVLRIVGTAAGFGYVVWAVDLGQVAQAMQRMPLSSIAACIAIMFAGMLVGTLRWRILFQAYGAQHLPALRRLFHVYLVGFFYNSYLPGGVGGDVLRGIVTRQAFGEAGATSGVAVVFVERVLGLAALLIVSTAGYWIRPLAGIDDLELWAAIGLAGATTFVIAIPLTRRFSQRTALGQWLRRLPALHSPPHFLAAFVLSLATQTLVALSGYVLLRGILPTVHLTDALVIVPVAAATAYLPFTVSGAGAREAAFIALCSTALALPGADAAAVSLLMWFCQLGVAGCGGIAHLARPFSAGDETS